MKISRNALRRLIESTLNESVQSDTFKYTKIFANSSAMPSENAYERPVEVDVSSGNKQTVELPGRPQAIIQEVRMVISGVSEDSIITIDSNTPFAVEGSGGPGKNPAKEYSQSGEDRYSIRYSNDGDGPYNKKFHFRGDGVINVSMFVLREENTQVFSIKDASLKSYSIRDEEF